MKKKFWKSPQFQALKDEWYQKLFRSGFEDVEDGQGRVRRREANAYGAHSGVTIEAKRAYYDLLGHGFHEEKFKSEIHRIVMERRADGVKIKDIVEELKKLPWLRRRRHSDTIRVILRHYEAKWGVKRK